MNIQDDLNAMNVAFTNLPEREKKLAVAKDVLTQLRAKKYEARTGSYKRVFAPDGDPDSMWAKGPDEFQQVLLKGEAHCQCCALGAAFLSLARLGGGIDLNVHHSYPLGDVWDQKEMQAIEEAFEGWDTNCAWVRAYPNDRERMVAIFTRIVEHQGVFAHPHIAKLDKR